MEIQNASPLSVKPHAFERMRQSSLPPPRQRNPAIPYRESLIPKEKDLDHSRSPIRHPHRPNR